MVVTVLLIVACCVLLFVNDGYKKNVKNLLKLNGNSMDTITELNDKLREKEKETIALSNLETVGLQSYTIEEYAKEIIVVGVYTTGKRPHEVVLKRFHSEDKEYDKNCAEELLEYLTKEN